LAGGAILLDARVAFDVEHMVSLQRAPEDSRGGSGRRHRHGVHRCVWLPKGWWMGRCERVLW
jgi:hypothetical protein